MRTPSRSDSLGTLSLVFPFMIISSMAVVRGSMKVKDILYLNENTNRKCEITGSFTTNAM